MTSISMLICYGRNIWLVITLRGDNFQSKYFTKPPSALTREDLFSHRERVKKVRGLRIRYFLYVYSKKKGIKIFVKK